MILAEINNQTKCRLSRQFIREAVRKFFAYLKQEQDWEISVALVGNGTMKRLNYQYREINKVTDVLSFGNTTQRLSRGRDVRSRGDHVALREAILRDPSLATRYLGEIIICCPRAKQQAKENKHSLKQEIKILLIHGLLHLLGYNHEKEKEAEEMKKLERKIFGHV